MYVMQIQTVLLKSASFIFLTLMSFSCLSQQLTQVSSGRIVSTRSDSRSVNFIDINSDGWDDIFISNGLQGGQDDMLYLNDGTGQFSEVKGEDIVSDGKASVGATFADYNNDGQQDGFVTNWYGQNDGLFRNDGTGNLIIQEQSAPNKGTFAEAGAWGDYDNDGLLDLYVTNSSGSKKNFLYQNLGNGEFKEITQGIVVNDLSTSRAVNWIYANDDRLLDLFVTNENNEANILYLNNGDGTFSSKVLGTGRSTFSSSWGDIDSDGDFDVFIGNTGITRGAGNKLFINDNGNFDQNINGTIHLDGGCTNGSAFGDYDNDGDLDLVVTNGFCDDQKNFIYENLGDGTLVKNDEIFSVVRDICSYGVAWGDINNDGFIDLMIANCKKNANDLQQTNDMYLNNGNENNWLKIKLEGVESNRDGIGATVKIKGSIQGQVKWQTRMANSQSGYSGQNSRLVHFGMGDAEIADSIIVLWPSGEVNVKANVSLGRVLNIKEGISTSSIEVKEQNPLKIRTWPNPFSIDNSSSLTVVLEKENLRSRENISISLHSLLGQTIVSNQSTPRGGDSHKMELSLSNKKLLPGVYLLRTTLSKREYSQKIIAF